MVPGGTIRDYGDLRDARLSRRGPKPTLQHPLRIFVVEDEVLLTMQLELYLRTAGHVVADTAASSGEAIARAAKVEADVALIDIHLADGPTGPEVGRFIAERPGL